MIIFPKAGESVRAPRLPLFLFWGWIIWSLANVRTHFSGHETVTESVVRGSIYFALLAGAVLAAVLVRIG
ncbi:MAG: hypothetical protein D3910_12440 [Candidatus Electrothrix sp. ATG2]|nr:hypothetical protein [Candidatus Electrothrix sp. ATG2]